LVVTVPADGPSNLGASSTYVLRAEDVVEHPNLCMNYPLVAGSLCYQLGNLQEAYGGYLVSPLGAMQANRPLGDPATYTTLPVSVTFWPFWAPPGGDATDARLLNLPLPPVFASVSNTFDVGFVSSSGLPLPTTSANNGPAISWITALPPSAAGYLGEIVVSTPFDDGYPDLTYGLSVKDSAGVVRSGVAEGANATFSPYPPLPAMLTVKRASGSPLGGDWKIYARDQATGRRLTSTATGASTAIRLNQISLQPVTSSELVVQPPPGAILPTLVDTTSGIMSESYPELPPILHVSGNVVAPDGNPVSATLLFFSSSQLDSVTTCEASTPATFPPLVYEATVKTKDLLTSGATKGDYAIDLPQGRYDVLVEPTLESGYAKGITDTNLHVAAAGAPVCTGSPIELSGVTLHAQDPVMVMGSVLTADGRPLSNATVTMTPASGYAVGRLLPVARPICTTAPCALLPSGIGLPEVEWPRPFQTTTGLDGSFTLAVDYCQAPSFCFYDLTVRPQDGTSFPWLVRPQRTYAPGALSLEPLIVPAPYYLNLTLEDSFSNVLTGAVVQAFSFNDGVALAIGDALTDENGHFTMMLSTAFAAN
jgi:hypothetical protein